MAVRSNDPRNLEEWMVEAERRIRRLESRQIHAGTGASYDHATETVSAKVSEDNGNRVREGEDGGLYVGPDEGASEFDPEGLAQEGIWIEKKMTGGVSIATNTDSIISWSITPVVQGTWTHTASTITIPVSAFYIVTFSWQWANNSTGRRAIKILRNGTSVVANSIFTDSRNATPGENNNLISEHRFLDAGDVIRTAVWQNSGGNLSGGGPYFGDIAGRWTIAQRT